MTNTFDSATRTNEKRDPWHRLRPAAEVGRSAPFYWLTVLALGGLSMACVCWAASSVLSQKGSEKLLRISLFLPKLNINHGERKADAFRMSEPVPSELAHPKERATLTPALIPPVLNHPKVTIVEAPQFAVGPAPTAEPPRFDAMEPWLLMVSKVEGAPPVEACHDPVVYLEPCAPQRGETPMMRNWKTLTMISLMAATTFTVAPPPVIAGEQKDSNVELKKSVDALRAELKRLEDGAVADIKRGVEKTNTDIGAMQVEQQKQKLILDHHKVLIDLLRAEVGKLPAPGAAQTPSVDKAFMEDLRSTLRTLNETVAKLGPTKERISMSPPNTNGATSGSRVMLANHYPDMLLFVVNGVHHRLPAFSTKLVDVPAGTLSYEVIAPRFGSLERQATTLAGGDTFNLSAR